LEPHLGVVSYGDDCTYVVADIPGLIEGAHAGTGLGLDFLRHVERTKLLLHVVDISSNGRNAVEDFLTIVRELELYSLDLLSRPQVVAASKMDALDEPSKLDALRAFCSERGLELFEISSVTGYGIERLVNRLGVRLQELGRTTSVTAGAC
jgi:GTP-binding protein